MCLVAQPAWKLTVCRYMHESFIVNFFLFFSFKCYSLYPFLQLHPVQLKNEVQLKGGRVHEQLSVFIFNRPSQKVRKKKLENVKQEVRIFLVH